jgi:hypothetical protein
MSKLLKKIGPETWFHGENSVQCTISVNNILIKGMSISIHNYKTISFSYLPFEDVFLLNKLNSLNFLRNILRGFYMPPPTSTNIEPNIAK